MPGSWKPEGYNSVSPYLISGNVQEVIDILRGALDGEPLRRPPRCREGDPDHRGGVTGPGGNIWWLSTRLEAE